MEGLLLGDHGEMGIVDEGYYEGYEWIATVIFCVGEDGKFCCPKSCLCGVAQEDISGFAAGN